MTERLLIAGVLLLAIVAIVAFGRLLIATRQQGVLRRERASRQAPATSGSPSLDVSDADRVLCFTTPDCVQCHEQQEPALDRLRARWPRPLVVEYVDALEQKELAARYGILTVPSTVVFAGGQARAVNYGYTPAEKIARQLDGQAYSI